MSREVETEAQVEIAVVVFGIDDAGRPHGSAFKANDRVLAERAAGLMGMHVLRPETDEQRALAAQLPRGRVFDSGKAFLPFVRAALYQSLAAMAGVSATPLAQPAISACAASQSPPEGMANDEGPSGTDDGEPPLPRTWGEIEVGRLVLATEGPAEGWFESVVLHVKDEVLTLKWRDWPKQRSFTRRRSQLALLPPVGCV